MRPSLYTCHAAPRFAQSHRSLAFAAAVSVATLAAAQSNPDASPSGRDRAVVELDPVEVSPFATETTALEMLWQSTSFVDQAAIERTSARSLEEALLSVPGVQARSRGGEDVRLSLRGSGLQSVVFTKARGVDLLVDGFPIGGADGNFDYSLLCPIMATDFSVHHGAAANSLGSLSLGGALNVATPTGQQIDPRLRLDVGSFGFFRLAGATGSATESGDFAAQFMLRREDGFRDFSSGDGQKLALNLGKRLSETAENRFFANLSRVRQSVSLPISQTELEQDPSQGRVNGPPGNFNLNALTLPYYEVHSLRLANRLTIDASPDARWEFGAYYLFRDVDFRRPSLPPTGFRMGPGWLEARTHDFGAHLRYLRSSELGGRPNDLVAGIRLSAQRGSEKLFPNLQTEKGPIFADGDLESTNAVAFIDNRWSWTDTLDLLAGARLFHSQRNYEDTLATNPFPLDSKQSFDGIAPRLGLSWRADESTELSASFSRNVEPPSFGDLIAIPVAPPPPQRLQIQELDAQEADVFEVALRSARGPLRWHASAYHAWLRDEIIRFAPDPGVATVGNQVGENAPRTRHLGLELGFDLTLWQSATDSAADRLRLFGQYTLREHRFDDDATFGDNELAGVAPQLLHAELLYEAKNGWYAGLNLSGSPQDYFIDNANTYQANSYLLLGARLGWQGQRWSLFLEGRNLADGAYAAALQNAIDAGGRDQSVFFPGEGRAFNIGLERRW